MLNAVFVDFYGTVVHEDGQVIDEITEIIARAGADRAEIGRFWWGEFQDMCRNAHGEHFETQRALERRSLQNTLRRFRSSADGDELSRRMFAFWQRPPLFEDGKSFFEESPLPVYIVSNIDRQDIMAAVEFHGLRPAGVFTSEDARAYKPRPELFRLALDRTGLKPDEVFHIGDSLSSDVEGANGAGIRAVWLNRAGRPVPQGTPAARSLTELLKDQEENAT